MDARYSSSGIRDAFPPLIVFRRLWTLASQSGDLPSQPFSSLSARLSLIAHSSLADICGYARCKVANVEGGRRSPSIWRSGPFDRPRDPLPVRPWICWRSCEARASLAAAVSCSGRPAPLAPRNPLAVARWVCGAVKASIWVRKLPSWAFSLPSSRNDGLLPSNQTSCHQDPLLGSSQLK